MKIITPILVLTAAAFLNMAGCQSTKDLFTPGNAQIAARFAAGKSLKYAGNAEDRVEIANYLYAAATGLRSLSASNGVPTPALVRETIKQYLKPGSKWTALANEIADVWELVVYPQIKAKPADVWVYLEAVAQGCEEAAAIYVNPIPLFSPIPGKSPIIGGNPPPPGSRPSPKPSPSDPVPTSGPDFSAPPTA